VTSGDLRQRRWFVGAVKRLLDIVVSGVLLLVTLPLFVAIAVAIKIDSRGPVFFRCRRAGLRGREFGMLKFRKMVDGAEGLPLTMGEDARFTGVGRFLARSKLDELPQLWNVLRGQMSLVGPRPEDMVFVQLWRDTHPEILSVRPGITGLSQLAFARESELLDPADPVNDYVVRLLPRKLALDTLYARTHTLTMDLRVLWWTVSAVAFDSDVAVHTQSGRLSKRRRPQRTQHQTRPPADMHTEVEA
jgi:lipopolysaccharide/colanic/teichoic acid biosynthesis glycosyltransferase